MGKLMVWVKRHAALFIAMATAGVFATTHLIIESEIFEFGPLSKNGLIHLLDLKALDLKFRSRTEEQLPEPQVVVAAIDEKGMDRFGLWPWSRSIVGEFIRKTTESGAKVIAFDAVFADEDKNSSYATIKSFLDLYQQHDLSPGSPRVKALAAEITAALDLDEKASRSLAGAEKAVRGPGKQAVVQGLGQARKLSEKRRRSLTKAFAEIEALGKRSDKFYELMAATVAGVSPDDALARAVAESPQTILGYVTFDHESEIVGITSDRIDAGFALIDAMAISTVYETEIQQAGDQEFQVMRPVPGVDVNNLQVHPVAAVLPPLARLAAAGKGFGYFNVSPDEDGPIRKVRLLHRHGDKLYPALSVLAGARFFDGEVRPIDSDIKPGRTLGGVNIGSGVDIPTDLHGRLLINYYEAPETYFPTVSVADIIDGKVGREQLEGKVVLFGMTAKGWFDLRANPFSAGTPGVYIHAAAVQNMIDGRFLERYYGFALIEILMYLLLGLGLGLVLPRIPAWAGVLATIAFAVALYFFDVHFMFSRGVWILTVLPTMQVGVTFVGVSVYGFLTEGREKRKIRKAFQFYLTKSVVDEMLKEPEKLKLGGERRSCTVLFSDIRGFTTISERLSPEELVSLLNSYLTPMTNLVFKYDGTLDKYMGDAIMAIFGAPVGYPNHATRAAYAALEMMEELHRLQDGWRKNGLPEIDIGIGLNTGPMSVGNMGSEIRFDYTVMGDNVNLGSRLEGINKQYGTNIIISEFTYAVAKQDIYARLLDAVRVKGKREPVSIYELLGKGKPTQDSETLIVTFEKAIDLYRAQRWDEAIEAFNTVRSQIKPNDYASTMYIQRCEAMRQNPPGEDWDGVYTMTTK